jgi:hypothetical protein
LILIWAVIPRVMAGGGFEIDEYHEFHRERYSPQDLEHALSRFRRFVAGSREGPFLGMERLEK